MATGGEDKLVRLWDLLTGKESLVVMGHTDAVNDVAYSPDGKSMATARSDGSARLWAAATGEELLRCIGHTGVVYAVRL